jgi:hypothetical protein
VLALLVVVLVLGGAGGRGEAAPTRDEVVAPVESYVRVDVRDVASTHAEVLRQLSTDVARCYPELRVERHGIAFREPRDGGALSLTLWVWVPALRDSPDGGARGDLPGRAGQAFLRYGQRLLRLLVARQPVLVDARVGGYGLVLTWLGPTARADGRLVGESVAVFADKVTVANYAYDAIGTPTFLGRSGVRLFDGETELGAARVTVADEGAPTPWTGC